jgi:lambda family phage portal protein
VNAIAKQDGRASGVLYADGSPVPVADVARVKFAASVNQGTMRGGVNAFDAANLFARETRDWFPTLRSSDSELGYDAQLIRARSRDLVRNDGWANGSITRIADAVVGSSFHPIPEPNFRALALESGNPAYDASWASEYRDAVMAEWRMWADDPLFYCDASRMMSVNQMLYLAYRHKIVDGDALAMPLWMPERMGYGAARYATAIQVIDPDRLSNPTDSIDMLTTRGGVEVDVSGGPVGYHIRAAHAYDWYAAGAANVWQYFERQTPWGRPLVVHDCDRDRAQQHRGLGILAPVLGRFKTLAKYDQVTLQKAVIKTLVGYFIKSPADLDQMNMVMSGAADGQQELLLNGYQTFRNSFSDPDGLWMGGVRMPVLAPGEDIATASVSGDADDFKTFEHTFLRSIAAATGESAEEMTKDYTETNYSSARAALLSVWRTVMRRRAGFASGFCNPIYVSVLEEMHARNRVPLPLGGVVPDFVSMRTGYGRCEWMGPGRGWIDPVKERQGEVLGLDAAFTTLKEVCGSISGRYYMDVLDQRQIEVAALKARGLPLPDWTGGQPQLDNASLIDEKPKAK